MAKLFRKAKATRTCESPKSFQIYGRIMNFYNSLGVFPLRWDSQNGTMIVKNSGHISLTIKSVLIIFHILFLDFQCAGVWLSKSNDRLEKFYLTLQAGVHSATIANFFIMVLHPSLLATLINNVLEMQKKYDGELLHFPTKRSYGDYSNN